MKLHWSAWLLAWCSYAPWACASDNHSLAAYRALERMPEVMEAPAAAAEPLEAFLKAEEKALEALLASQEAWAVANLEKYPPRPAALAFVADPERSDAARKLAFLQALRVAADSRFALYVQADPWSDSTGTAMPSEAVRSVAQDGAPGEHFYAAKPGDTLSALAVLASASDEPNYGMDAYLWDDSPSAWGKRYALGRQPFGSTNDPGDAQASVHAAFLHESGLFYAIEPALARAPLLQRANQFSTLAAFAFRTDHAYWGWRFSGIALHYLQDLTQPYQSAMLPGESAWRQMGARALALMGWSGARDRAFALHSARLLAVQRYQNDLLQNAAQTRTEGILEKALHDLDQDNAYPTWSDAYLRDVVALQAAIAAPALTAALNAALPTGALESAARNGNSGSYGNALGPLLEQASPESRRLLNDALAEALGHFGAHSRNALRAILRAARPF